MREMVRVISNKRDLTTSPPSELHTREEDQLIAIETSNGKYVL